MFDLGTQELIVIFIVAFLVFGPKKLPELGRTLGKGIRELKSAMRNVQNSFDETGSDIKNEFDNVKSDLEDSIYKSIESTIDKKEKESRDADGTEKEPAPSAAVEEEQAEKKETDKDE